MCGGTSAAHLLVDAALFKLLGPTAQAARCNAAVTGAVLGAGGCCSARQPTAAGRIAAGLVMGPADGYLLTISASPTPRWRFG